MDVYLDTNSTIVVGVCSFEFDMGLYNSIYSRIFCFEQVSY